MALPDPKRDRYTYADMLEWPEEVRYELIGGIPYLMSAPSRRHQGALAELFYQIRSFLEGKPCRVYPAPFDVRLFEQDGDAPEDVDTVVEPDLVVICDRDKLDDRGSHGAPDLIIEILSPSTRKRDRERKFDLYCRAGVRGYWIVDPDGKTVETFLLREGLFVPGPLAVGGGTLAVEVLEGCTVDLDRVFEE